MRVFAIIFTIIANLTDLFKEKTKGQKWHRWPEADAWLSPEGQFESPCGASGPECLSRPHGTETRLRQEFAGGAAGGTQMALASWKPETHSATPPGASRHHVAANAVFSGAPSFNATAPRVVGRL